MKNFLSDFAQAIKWSKSQYSDLPWRKDRSFYKTLVSEIMLQQTTVSTVKNRFATFLNRYPDMLALAKAPDEELLRLWQGLGYYNRAKRLRAAATSLIELKPEKLVVEDLLKLSGIGDYTANALLAIGLNKPALALDVNMVRVFVRYFGLKKNSKEDLKTFFQEELAVYLKDFRGLHEVVMDIGRTFCQARSRACQQCPMKQGCVTFKTNRDYYANLKNKERKDKKNIELLRLVCIEKDEIYLQQRLSGQWLAGQWEIPSFVLKGELAIKQYPKIKSVPAECKILSTFKTTITNHLFVNKVCECSKKQL